MGGAKRVLFSWLALCLAFASVEGTLALIEWVRDTPVFVTPWDLEHFGHLLDDKNGIFQVVEPLGGVIQRLPFRKEPKPGVTRVVIFGGSVANELYLTAFYDSWEKMGRGEVEAIDLGGTGFSSRLTYRVWTEALDRVTFDVAVIAIGHNEYLDVIEEEKPLDLVRSIRTVRMLGEVVRYLRPRVRINVSTTEDSYRSWIEPRKRKGEETTEQKAAYLERFELFLEKMLAEAKARKLRVLLVQLGSNPRFPPEVLQPEARVLSSQILEDLRQGELEEARYHTEEILHVAPTLARWSFYSGLSAELAGDAVQAGRWYRDARDRDMTSTRDISGFYEVRSRLARKYGVRVLDMRQVLSREAKRLGWITTAGFYRDDCHYAEAWREILPRELARELCTWP